MHILIFQTGEPLHIDHGNYRPMRAISLANKLSKKGFKVTLISSSFFHQRKYHRSNTFKSIKVSNNIEIILIPSLGYKKHISIRRIIDHITLSFNLKRYLDKRKNFKPDRIFLGYPPIETSLIVVNWASRKNIPIMLDIKDNWPINFIEPFPKIIRPFLNTLIFPYFILAKFIFRKCKYINTISEEFVEWIKQFTKNKNKQYSITPLVREPVRLNSEEEKNQLYFWKKNGVDLKRRQHFSFVGSLTKSFDFDFIFEYAKYLHSFYPEYKFIICGSGDLAEELITKSKRIKNIIIFGEIDKFKAKVLIKYSLATLAPYANSENFKNSIPNKIIESLENGTPFITNLDGKLYEMTHLRGNGIYIPGKNKKFIKRFIRLIKDDNYQKRLSINAIKSYQELFDFENNYERLINNLINMV